MWYDDTGKKNYHPGIVSEEVIAVATIHRARKMAIGDVRKRLAEICDEVKYTGESVVVTKHSKPTSAIVPIEDYEFLQEITVRRALQELKKRGAVPLEDIDDNA